MEDTQKAVTAAEEAKLSAAASASGGGEEATRSPSKRKISEDLESTPSPHKAGVQRHIAMPKPMKL
ncbi:unnamed protein product [Ectocarpus fasciculatus]